MSAIEGSLAKAEKLEQLMNLIASKIDLLSTTKAALVPSTPTLHPDTVTIAAPSLA